MTVCHPFHIRHEARVRSGAANGDGHAARTEAGGFRKTGAGACQIRHHLEVECTGGADGTCAGDGSKRRDYQVDLVEARAFGRVAHIRTQVLDSGVIAGLLASQGGDGR